MVRPLFLLIYSSNYSTPSMCFVCNGKKNCPKYWQKCEPFVHCLARGRPCLLWVCPSPAGAGFGNRPEGETRSLWGEGGALSQCGSCVGVTLVRITGRTGQNLPLRGSLSLRSCQIWLGRLGKPLKGGCGLHALRVFGENINAAHPGGLGDSRAV